MCLCVLQSFSVLGLGGTRRASVAEGSKQKEDKEKEDKEKRDKEREKDEVAYSLPTLLLPPR